MAIKSPGKISSPLPSKLYFPPIDTSRLQAGFNLLLLTLLVAVAWLLFNPQSGYARDHEYYFLSNVKARALAMGGAVTAVEDDLGSIGYNPASFFLYNTRRSGSFGLFFNTTGAIIGGVNYGEIFEGEGKSADDLLTGLSLLVKGVTFSTESWDFGLLLGERGLGLPDEFVPRSATSVSGYRQNHSHSLVASLKLAKKVSLGGTISHLMGSDKSNNSDFVDGFSVSYGILLQPESRLRVGVSYMNLPDSLTQFRTRLERLVDEAINVGVSYQPFDGTLLSLDLRNLSEESLQASREAHFGFEQVVMSHFALRAGFFSQSDGANIFSGGIGLFDWNGVFGSESIFNHRNFVLNYTFVYEHHEYDDQRMHFLSALLRI